QKLYCSPCQCIAQGSANVLSWHTGVQNLQLIHQGLPGDSSTIGQQLFHGFHPVTSRNPHSGLPICSIGSGSSWPSGNDCGGLAHHYVQGTSELFRYSRPLGSVVTGFVFLYLIEPH